MQNSHIVRFSAVVSLVVLGTLHGIRSGQAYEGAEHQPSEPHQWNINSPLEPGTIRQQADQPSSALPTTIPTDAPPAPTQDAPPAPKSEPALLRQHIRLHIGAGWHIVTPSGVGDQSTTKLSLGIDYGLKLLARPDMALAIIFPFSMQINTSAFYENSFFASQVGVQLDVKLYEHLWAYATLSGGLGTGFVHAETSTSQTGLATQMALGIKVHTSRFDIALEPISIPIFSTFGPNSSGSISSLNATIATSVNF